MTTAPQEQQQADTFLVENQVDMIPAMLPSKKALRASLRTDTDVSATIAAEDDLTEYTDHSVSLSSVSFSLLEPMMIRDPLKRNTDFLYKINLRQLNCQFDTVTQEPGQQRLQRVVRDQCAQQATDVTVLFAVRYPLCGSCREHGRALANLVASERRVSLIGTIKGGTNQFLQSAVLDFYQEIFQRNQLYQDETFAIGKALGGRRVSIFTMMRNMIQAQKRWKKKNVMPKARIGLNDSDKLGLGGVLIFDKQGILRFALPECVGEEADMDMIAAAFKETRRMGRRSTRSNNGSFRSLAI